jgi:hypothetical protein
LFGRRVIYIQTHIEQGDLISLPLFFKIRKVWQKRKIHQENKNGVLFIDSSVLLVLHYA